MTMKVESSIVPFILLVLHCTHSHGFRHFSSKNVSDTRENRIKNNEDVLLKFSFVSDASRTSAKIDEFGQIKQYIIKQISTLQYGGLMSNLKILQDKTFLTDDKVSVMYLRIMLMRPKFGKKLQTVINHIQKSLLPMEKLKRELAVRVTDVEACIMEHCITLMTDEVWVYGDCSNIGGKCQNNTLQCNGSYLKGKCTGPADVLCCTPNVTLQDTKTCANVEVFSRNSWGARSPISPEHLPGIVNMFFIHHTAGQSCTTKERCAQILRSIQRFHMQDRKWGDIAYSFLVGEDGRIYEGRGWQRVGAHTKGYNSRSLAVSVMGTYEDHVPNNPAIKAVQNLLTCATTKGYIYNTYSLYGHRDVRDTECPGDALYNLIRTWPHYNTTTDLDGPCLKEHGICKPNYLSCSGSYKKGLCNGYSRRQCCVPSKDK